MKDLQSLLQNNEDLQDGQIFMVRLPQNLREYLDEIAAINDEVEQDKINESSLLNQSSLFAKQQDSEQINDEQLSIDSDEKRNIGAAKALKRARKREAEKWKLPIGQIDVISIGDSLNKVQLQIFDYGYQQPNINIQKSNASKQIKKKVFLKNFSQNQINQFPPKFQYEAQNDEENHPLIESEIADKANNDQLKLLQKRNKVSSDAYIIKMNQFKNPNENRIHLKIKKRLSHTLRLKNTKLDTQTLMKSFEKAKQVQQIEKNPEDIEERFEKNIYNLIPTNILKQTLKEREEEEENRRPADRKYAKDEDEMRIDILNFFKERPGSRTWEEFKQKFDDQPNEFLKQMVGQLCDKVGSGQGGNMEFVLKSSFVMQ